MGSSPSKNALAKPTILSDFQSLPYEIREQVWLETLTPRLIYLHPHEGLSPPRYDFKHNKIVDGERSTVSVRFNYSTHHPSTTPDEAFSAYASFISPDPSKANGGGRGELKYDRIMCTRALTYKSANPPPALYVCQESRAIALKNGYVLAFKGVDHRLEGKDKKYWQRHNLSDKGVWINFKRDIVMLDVCYPNRRHFRYDSRQSLILINKWAPEDVKRIKQLALGGTPSMVHAALKSKVLVFKPPWGRLENQWWGRLGFDNLEEIWIDDGFETKTHSKCCGCRPGWETVAGRYWNRVWSRVSLEKSKFPGPTLSVTQVKVVRGEQWHIYF
ncbi:hypothetical protein EG329_012634 [Mollisiaceae sp. DMI_Dod_QoI]|nr:hypothetical protein EG329_012634 [Helotiales sp. DMI_Dod_QoI]